MLRVLALLLLLCGGTLAASRCFHVVGSVKCERDPGRVMHTQVAVHEKDSEWPGFDHLDKDERVGVSVVTDASGEFEVHGCGDDHDWVWFYKNEPEFYFKIFHYCNGDEGDEREIMPTWRVFMPVTYYPTPFVLDYL